MALCIKHHTTPRTPCPILMEQRVTRKTILAFKVPASRVHPGFSNADDLHGFCRDHGLELQPLVPYWAGIQQHHPESPYGLTTTTEGDPFPEGDGSGPRSFGSSSSRPSWSHLLFWLGPWVGLTDSPIGGLRGLFEGPLGGSGEPDPPGARELPSMCGLWTRSITKGGWLGGGTVSTLVGASGGDFLGGARLAVTPLLGGPASGALSSALPGPQDLDPTGL